MDINSVILGDKDDALTKGDRIYHPYCCGKLYRYETLRGIITLQNINLSVILTTICSKITNKVRLQVIMYNIK